MARPLRRKLKFDEESVNNLLQEIYDDTHNIRGKVVRLFTKWELKVKEGGEIAALGDQIVKLIAAEAKNQDQKIMLLKYLKEVVFDNNSAGKKPVDDETEKTVGNDRRRELIDMVRDHIDNKA
jgi:hypothetical protein